MELIKVTKSGAIHFKLDDGRLGATYNNGYVRVSTKRSNIYTGRISMYQINKKISIPNEKNPQWDNYKRELIDNCSDRVRRLLEFNNNNCKTK